MKTKIYFLRGENRFVRYVGKTTRTLESRLWCHLDEAKKGHVCKKCCGVRAMFHKGLSPTIDLITEVEGNGDGTERAYIKWLRGKGVDLWNMADGGGGGYIGKEGIEKIRRALTGRKRSAESIRKGALHLLGKKRPEEIKRKISKTLMGHTFSKESRKKSSISHKGQIPWSKGKYLSEEHCKKQSIAQLRRFSNPNERRKLSNSHKGKIPWNKGIQYKIRRNR